NADDATQTHSNQQAALGDRTFATDVGSAGLGSLVRSLAWAHRSDCRVSGWFSARCRARVRTRTRLTPRNTVDRPRRSATSHLYLAIFFLFDTTTTTHRLRHTQRRSSTTPSPQP